MSIGKLEDVVLRWCVWCHDRIEDGGQRYLCARCARMAELFGKRPSGMKEDDGT